MAVISYGKVVLFDRKYPSHSYTVERYARSGKINVRVASDGMTTFLKMSLDEAKDFVLRMQFAIHEAENG